MSAPAAAALDAPRPYRPRLTPEVHDKLVRVFRLGGTVEIAAGSCRLAPRTFREWTARGRADLDEGRTETAYARLALDCEEARHKGDVALLDAVRLQAMGRQCRTCQGTGTITGLEKGDRGRLVRCPGCRGKGYARAPDGKLALELLGRRHVGDYGKKVDQRIEITGEGGGPVRVDTRAAAVLLDATGLAALSVEQLAALAHGGTAPSIASATRGALPAPRLPAPRRSAPALPLDLSRDVIDAPEVEAGPVEAVPAEAEVEVEVEAVPVKRLTFAGLGAAVADLVSSEL